jgi:hypothetical protein
MRLIDADVLKDIVKNKYSDIIVGGYPYNVVAYDMAKLIEIQPTAYDIDKVVEQIKERIQFFEGLSATDDEEDKLAMNCVVNGLYRGLEIVREGGITDETSKG